MQILLALLKANNIKRVIASPGTTNLAFVGSVQNDPYFEVFSSVDERSAAYMACGMAAQTGEPVVISCTGATASRDYYPGLTEAYYRKLPVLAVTSHHGVDQLGHLITQNIDRRRIPNDIAKLSVELPSIRDDRDEFFVTMEANKAILELSRDGGGPVHINLQTTFSRDFSVKELPKVIAIRRFYAWNNLPPIEGGKIGVFVGSHRTFSKSQTEAIDSFCASYDAVVICDHTSGYYGKYRLQPTLLHLQESKSSPLGTLDLMIHIGEASGASYIYTIKSKEVWRVSEDGEIRNPFKKLTTVFQMSEEFFFNRYRKNGSNMHSFIDKLKPLYEEVYELIPELPFSNIWAAEKLSKVVPEGAVFHISASNTRRCWNIFHLPKDVISSSNVGCCGIDGCSSSMIGASLTDRNRIFYLVTGDLAFFYDYNVVANRHVGKNVRIMMINNGIGAEFKLYTHPCHVLGEQTNAFMAAEGHNGNKSEQYLKHIAEDLGYQYLSAKTKEDFIKLLPVFSNPNITDRPIIFEIFTTAEDESEALKIMSNLSSDAKAVAKQIGIEVVNSFFGQKGIETVKKIIGKK